VQGNMQTRVTWRELNIFPRYLACMFPSAKKLGMRVDVINNSLLLVILYFANIFLVALDLTVPEKVL
jgi:hypothetical protein